MLSKKILCLLLSAASITPAASAIVENLEPQQVEAATNFISQENLPTTPKSSGMCLYGIMPSADINGDGTLDILDYTLLRKYLVNGGEKSNIKLNKYAADVNMDGVVDFFDLVALKDLL